MENEKKHKCPICNTNLEMIPRYPRYVCRECAKKVTDKKGRGLTLSNSGLYGGYEAIYSDTKEKYDSHICFIDGKECYADEARFGGIVIQTK